MSEDSCQKSVYKYILDYGRHGVLEKLLVMTPNQLKWLTGKRVYWGEVLGKHSNVIDDECGTDSKIKKVSDNKEVVDFVEQNNLDKFPYIEEIIREREEHHITA